MVACLIYVFYSLSLKNFHKLNFNFVLDVSNLPIIQHQEIVESKRLQSNLIMKSGFSDKISSFCRFIVHCGSVLYSLMKSIHLKRRDTNYANKSALTSLECRSPEVKSRYFGSKSFFVLLKSPNRIQNTSKESTVSTARRIHC